MGQRHLIALDLDGTLLTDDKQISPYTLKVVEKAIAEGHVVVIATGRPHRASIQYYEQMKLNTAMLNFNGALLHHPLDKKWDYIHTPLPQDTAIQIVNTCYELDVYNILAEVEDSIFLDRHDEKILDIFRSSLPKQLRDKEPFHIGSLGSALVKDPTSLLIHPKEQHIIELREHLDLQHAELIEHRKWGAPWNIIEIVKKGVNKAVGLQKLAEHYRIPQERIMAFGDEDNDLEMIEFAGIGIAMENAIEPLKGLADHITKTNEEHGVATFLSEYLNLKVELEIYS